MAEKTQEEINSSAITEALRFAYKNNKPMAPLTGYFQVNVEPVPRTSYFVAVCANCKTVIPLFEDPSKGALGNPFAGPGGFRVMCPKCGTRNQIESHQLKSTV